MAESGDILSFAQMCVAEGKMLQQGMHFKSGSDRHSVILLSRRPGSRYPDRISDDGKTLFYVGHDAPGDVRKVVDQPRKTPSGSPTENGKFFAAAEAAKLGFAPEPVRAYEKLKTGIWVYDGLFLLRDARLEEDGSRKVCVFVLELASEANESSAGGDIIPQSFGRIIPTEVKLAVWRRDHARCTQCASEQDLHFDHIIPFSLGGSSLDPKNIQLLCGRCNISKGDEIV